MNTDKIVATFNDNISYIQSTHPLLFSKLLALDDAVADGHYKEQYELVFDNGYFDVLEIREDIWGRELHHRPKK